MKAERLSYDTITPSAARGVLEAIYWKPEITWVVDRLHVLKPIRFTSLRRNEVKDKISATTARSVMKAGRGPLGIYVDEGPSRQQRAATLLRDVEYVIEAHFRVVGGRDPDVKHFEMFKRRAEKGQYFHHPYLGCREFIAAFEWHDGPNCPSPLVGTRDLGLMLHDIDFRNGLSPRFFHAIMVDGVIDVPCLELAEKSP